MSSMRIMLALAVLPLLAASSFAQTAQTTKPMDKTRAIRAECFRQANAAVQANVGMASANPAAAAEANAYGTDAYHSCLRKSGLKR